MARLFVEIGAKVGEFQKALSRIERDVNRFSRKMESLGANLTQAIALPLAAFGGASVGAFASFERLEKGLVAVTGDAAKAAVEMENLKRSARLPGLGFEEAVKGSIGLQAVGLSADEARRTLEVFGTAIAATGGNAQNLDSVQYQLTQMISKNRILQEDFGILQENVPLLGKALEAAFGTTNLANIRDTGISAQDFNNRLVAGLAGLKELENVTGGLSNAFDNFGDSVKFSLVELGRSVATALNLEVNLSKVASVIDRVAMAFSSLTPEVQATIIKIALFVAAIGPVLLIIGKLSSLIPVLLIGLKNIAGVFGLLSSAVTFFLSPIGLAVGLIAGLAVAIVVAYNRSLTFRKAINGLINVIVELGNIAGDVVANLAKGFGALTDFRFEDAFDSFNKALTNINPIAGLAEGQGGRIGKAFKAGFDDETNRLDEGIAALKSRIFKATSGILPAAQAAGPRAGVGSPDPDIGRALKDFEKLRQKLAELPTIETRNLIPESLAPATAAVAGQVSRLSGSLQGLGIDADSMVVAQERAAGLLEEMQPLADLLAGPIQDGFSSLFETLIEGGANAFGGFIKAIKNLILQLITAVATAAALSLILNAVTGGAVGGFGGVLKSILGGGGLGGIFKLFPGFAEGGIVPPGYPNDSYYARLTSGEAVIPLNKINQYAGSVDNGPLTGEIRLAGNDLVIALERFQNNRARTRGK